MSTESINILGILEFGSIFWMNLVSLVYLRPKWVQKHGWERFSFRDTYLKLDILARLDVGYLTFNTFLIDECFSSFFNKKKSWCYLHIVMSSCLSSFLLLEIALHYFVPYMLTHCLDWEKPEASLSPGMCQHMVRTI